MSSVPSQASTLRGAIRTPIRIEYPRPPQTTLRAPTVGAGFTPPSLRRHPPIRLKLLPLPVTSHKSPLTFPTTASRLSNSALTPGHSESITLKYTVCRILPLEVSI
jgi:hypothetical protein